MNQHPLSRKSVVHLVRSLQHNSRNELQRALIAVCESHEKLRRQRDEAERMVLEPIGQNCRVSR